MIYTKLCDLNRCRGICPSLDTAIDWLQSADLNALTPGRNEIDGDRVFVNRLDYETIPPEAAAWEGHEQYGDVHIMVSGAEYIGVSHKSVMAETVRRPESDFLGFTGPVRTWFPMEQEDVLIVFPEDIHLVKVMQEAPCPVTRAVIKFRV